MLRDTNYPQGRDQCSRIGRDPISSRFPGNESAADVHVGQQKLGASDSVLRNKGANGMSRSSKVRSPPKWIGGSN